MGLCKWKNEHTGCVCQCEGGACCSPLWRNWLECSVSSELFFRWISGSVGELLFRSTVGGCSMAGTGGYFSDRPLSIATEIMLNRLFQRMVSSALQRHQKLNEKPLKRRKNSSQHQSNSRSHSKSPFFPLNASQTWTGVSDHFRCEQKDRTKQQATPANITQKF